MYVYMYKECVQNYLRKHLSLFILIKTSIFQKFIMQFQLCYREVFFKLVKDEYSAAYIKIYQQQRSLI